MRSILDDLEAMTASERQHFGHVTGKPAEVDRHDCLASRRQTALRMVEIDAASALINVDQHDFRANIADDGGRRCERKCRYDYFIARTDAASLSRKMQPRGRRVNRDSFDVSTHEGCELLLEFASLGAGGEPAGPQHGCCRCDLF